MKPPLYRHNPHQYQYPASRETEARYAHDKGTVFLFLIPVGSNLAEQHLVVHHALHACAEAVLHGGLSLLRIRGCEFALELLEARAVPENVVLDVAFQVLETRRPMLK